MSLFIDKNNFAQLSAFTLYRVVNLLPQNQNQIIQKSILQTLHSFPLKHRIIFPITYCIPKCIVTISDLTKRSTFLRCSQFSFSLFPFSVLWPSTLKLYFIQPQLTTFYCFYQSFKSPLSLVPKSDIVALSTLTGNYCT